MKKEYIDVGNLALECVRVTEAAALSASKWIGRGNNNAADEAAVYAMRKTFNNVNVQGKIVIGEGERDKAPMLFIGEQVGTGNGPEVDIAVDPLEGTTITAQGRYNALSVLAIGNKGKLLNAPDMYMNKIAVGPEARGVIDLFNTTAYNLRNIAKAKEVSVRDLTVVILNRERHRELIAEVRELGSRIHLIQDGDISAALATCWPNTGIDVLMGTGGAPEGVISAAALRCLGGDMQGRLMFTRKGEKEQAHSMGIKELWKVYSIEELAGGDVMFAATGVTDGDFNKISTI